MAPLAADRARVRQDAPDPPRAPFIPLAHKRVPTEMRAPADHVDMLFAALVGDVDITALRAKLMALPEEQWGEDYNRTHNVYFQRPFHDKIGVQNIMCLFSDTQLESVYRLPLYDDYAPLLEPIFAAVGVDPAQVVRCLFARMPGQTVIPAHHDNGPWVSKTHRMHVPIVTFPSVSFKSGALETSMERYALNEGAVVELNNAAKHAVHNPTDERRIHLIFDYVEKSHPIKQRMTLKAGQVCRQVRGKVELVDHVDPAAEKAAKRRANQALLEVEKMVQEALGADAAATLTQACRHYFIEQINAKTFVRRVRKLFKGADDALTEQLWSKIVTMFGLVDPKAQEELTTARRTPVYAPNWTIIGAQKCGTTSLFQYLGQHPLVRTGKRREPHFFDWAWNKALKHDLSVEERGTFEPVLAAYDAALREQHVERNDTVPTDIDLAGNNLDTLRLKYLLSLKLDDPDSFRPPMQTGESTPSYLLYGATVAKRMRTLYPDMKLIVMLRDPVKRAFSHFQMTADPTGTPQQLQMRRAVQGKSFEDVLADDLKLLEAAEVTADAEDAAERFQRYADQLSTQHGAHSYIGRGLYALQLELWLQHFPRDQVLVIDLDDMKTPEGVQTETNRAFEFLELPPHEVLDTERKNTRAYDPLGSEVKEKLRAFYAPFNQRLFELVGKRFNW